MVGKCKCSLEMAACVSHFFRCFGVIIEITIAEIELLALMFDMISDDGRSVLARLPCGEEIELT